MENRDFLRSLESGIFMFVDGDIEELRELVKKNLALTEETHRIVRGMRSAARWGRFFSIVWWLIVIAVTGATYYIYVQPYVEQIEKAYGDTQNLGQQVQDFFHSFGQQTKPPSQSQ